MDIEGLAVESGWLWFVGSRRLPDDEATQVSGHSMRVGAAQDLMTSGRDILMIMRAGGWKSMNVVARHVENAGLQIWD